MIERLRGAMESNYVWIIIGYHWAGYSRAVGPAAAGLFRIPYRRWAPLDYGGGALWAIGYTMLGVLLGFLGVEFSDTKTLVRLLEFLFLGVFVVAILLAWYRTSKGEQRAAATHLATVVVPVDDEQA
jgi:membrane protein DedA with SNARE-associated domain